jgi:hypothetical protein
VVGAGAVGNHCIRALARGRLHICDQLLGAGPVEPHAALGRVHCLGDAETEVPKIFAERNSAFPVDVAVEPGIVVGQWIDHHVRCCVGDAIEGVPPGRAFRRGKRRVDDGVVVQRAGGNGKAKCRCHGRQATLRTVEPASEGTSTQRRSFQLL